MEAYMDWLGRGLSACYSASLGDISVRVSGEGRSSLGGDDKEPRSALESLAQGLFCLSSTSQRMVGRDGSRRFDASC